MATTTPLFALQDAAHLPQSDPGIGSSAVDFQEFVTRCMTLGFAAVKVNFDVSRSCTRLGLHALPHL